VPAAPPNLHSLRARSVDRDPVDALFVIRRGTVGIVGGILHARRVLARRTSAMAWTEIPFERVRIAHLLPPPDAPEHGAARVPEQKTVEAVRSLPETWISTVA
jgi:hypothetical protein